MKTLNQIKSYFPSGKSKWIKYTLTSLPIIFSAMIFSLNSFVDNFMAIEIPGGNQALSYSNTWTSICTGIITSTTIVGSSLFGQYWGVDDKVKIREVVRARMLIAFSIAIIFAIPNISAPQAMIRLASGFDQNLSQVIVNQASQYNRIIAISWLLHAWCYTSSMIMRESNFGKASLLSSIICLISNITFNAVFIYGLKEDLVWLAFSTIISLTISIIFLTIYTWKFNKKAIFNPIKMFNVSKIVWQQIIRRSPSFFFATIASIAVSVRFIFWNIGYPSQSVGANPDYYLSAGTILGISGMFFNIFWTTIESINANVAIFVGWELGNNNVKQAKINAKELQGFQFCLALILGIILFSLSFAIEKMDFLTRGYVTQLKQTLIDNGNDLSYVNSILPLAQNSFLLNLKHTIWPLAWFMPIWIIFITESRIISVGGGMTNVTSMVDAIFGIVQTGWICLINLVIVKHTNLEFPWAYTIFFTSDIFKIFVYGFLYQKLEWARNITKEGEKPKSLPIS